MHRLLTPLFVLVLLFAGAGRGAAMELGYYLQAASGQLSILFKRQPVERLVRDPATPTELRQKLQLATELRDFASRDLLLPENGSYRTYVDLGRDAVVWNVVAAPEFSLTPKTWCFPVAGCVSYRGYYDRAEAEAYAQDLRREGYDVDLYPVSAYSTLGWFDDPLLNTFIDRSEPALAGLIFHELAHQKLYVKDDSSFSEAFASAVEDEGVRRWLQLHPPDDAAPRSGGKERWQTFWGLLLATRAELEKLYASSAPAERMRAEKGEILNGLRQRYAELRNDVWHGYGGYDGWFDRPVNNARLAAVATYHDKKPAFVALLQENDNNLAKFYEAAAALARLPKDARDARLKALESGQKLPD